MVEVDVVRAWKDEEYRTGLPQEVQDQLPAAPAGLDELSDEQLQEAAGAGWTFAGFAATVTTGVAATAVGATGLGVGIAAATGAFDKDEKPETPAG